ncbi:MAG: glycosyltransferase [Christensenellales bacterium]|jgi:glycosyltransferase involved in cell wall biosynthesis
MTANIPKISVIIPVYNAAKFLTQNIESLLNQSLKEIEIICVDDCSSDHSADILKEYAKKDDRVTVLINETNLKAGATRNRGLAAATGEYVHFLDADDYMVLDAYEVLYEQAKSNDLDLLKAKAYAVDAKTQQILPNSWYSLKSLDSKDFNKITNFYDMPDKFVRVAVAPWSGIYKRSFLVENDIRFNHLICVNDRSFYNEVIINSKSVMFIDYYFLYHRVNVPGSLVAGRAKNFDCHFKSYDIIKQQSAFLAHKELLCILESELQDIFAWYRKYQREHVLEEEIFTQTKAFIDQLDVSVFKDKLINCRWYKDYLKIKNFLPVNDKKTAAKIKKNNKIFGFFKCCKDHGINYTLRLMLQKFLKKLEGR